MTTTELVPVAGPLDLAPDAELADGTPLSPSERDELNAREEDMERDRDTIANAHARFAVNLLNIHDRRLYRETHGTFEAYCRERWGFISRAYPYRLIEHARTFQAMSSIEDAEHVVFPTAVGQTKPLDRLPIEQRPEVWNQAVAENAGNVPNGKQVAAVVERIAPRPAKPKPNGDPSATVAAMRKAGVIGQRTEVQIHDPSRGVEPEASEEPATEPELVTDEEWARSLPTYAKIGEHLRTRFVADVCHYRRTEDARREFIRVHTKSKNIATKDAGGVTPRYAGKIAFALATNDPTRWQPCDACEGQGMIPIIGQCAGCKGHGYHV